MARNYENFDIEIVREGDAYSARARSPRGEARAAFVLPLSQQEIRILGLTVARGRQTTRSIQTREVDEVKAYGQRLFDALFTGDVLACYHESLAQVRSDIGTGLRMRLRLTDTPELAQVPWEYTYDRRSGRFLALDDETPIVRYLDLPLPAGALEVEPPLRVLVMIAGPEDVADLDADEEWRRINDALADMVQQGAVRLDRLAKPTLSALRWQLRAEDYHVFHFIGHGGVDAITERGVLILEDDARRSDVVDAETIAGILSGERTLRLAVLNACEGGRASKGDIFAGTAQTLVQQDVPAVIAMQFQISDEAAITLTHDFYKALSFGDPVDAALTEARRGLRFEHRNELEWGTPVLYMRASDGRLFDVKSKPAPRPNAIPEPKPQPSAAPPIATLFTAPPAAAATPPAAEPAAARRRTAELLQAAQVAAYSEKWAEATGKLEQILEIDPHHKEAATRLEAVRREEQLAVLFNTGLQHETAAQFGAAIDSYKRARDLAGSDYRGVDARIARLREQAKGKRSPKQVIWIRIGKIAVGLWALGIVVALIVPEPEMQSAAPDGSLVSQPVTAPAPDAAQPQPYNPPVQPAPRDAGVAPNRDAEAAEAGLSPYGSAVWGSLAQSTYFVHPFILEGGKTYTIAGSCDNACTDLDLLVSANGVPIVKDDTPGDALPVIRFEAAAGVLYQVTVEMVGCSNNTCAYRAQAYH